MRTSGPQKHSDQAGTSRASARARARTKKAASSLHRPPTSTAKTAKRQRSERSSSGSALCGGVQGQGRRPEHARAGQGRYQRGVHGELLPAPQRQAIGNDLKPPVVDRPGDSCLPSGCCKSPSPRPRGTRAAARSRGHPQLRRTPARAQAARWSPRESKGRRHRQ